MSYDPEHCEACRFLSSACGSTHQPAKRELATVIRDSSVEPPAPPAKPLRDEATLDFFRKEPGAYWETDSYRGQFSFGNVISGKWYFFGFERTKTGQRGKRTSARYFDERAEVIAHIKERYGANYREVSKPDVDFFQWCDEPLPPKRRSGESTVRLSAEIVNRLRLRAQQNNRSINAEIDWLLGLVEPRPKKRRGRPRKAIELPVELKPRRRGKVVQELPYRMRPPRKSSIPDGGQKAEEETYFG
jgi:hypothetical protein